jgi:hypothetical protein
MAGVDVFELLRKWNAENPRYLNPEGPVLLAKPEDYDIVVMSSGLTLVKGLYGSGKTYGYGFKIYHDARQSGKMDALYINLRTIANTYIKSSAGNIVGNIIDIINIICKGLNIPSNQRHGVFMITNEKPIYTVCSDYKRYIDMAQKRRPVEVFREFLIDLADKASKRLMIIIDEFEGIEVLLGRKSKQDVFDYIRSTLEALRPGVMETHPHKLSLLYLVQEVVYPSQQMEKYIKETATPALGRAVANSPDGSIHVKYNLDSINGYIANALEKLKEQLSFNEQINEQLVSSFFEKETQRVLSRLLVLPAFNSFYILNLAIAQSVEKALDREIINPRQILEELTSKYEIYRIYDGKKPYSSNQLANSLGQILTLLLTKTMANLETPPIPVKRTGYEGSYYVGAQATYIIMLRSTDVKSEETFKKAFSSAYREPLSHCLQQTEKRKGKESKCLLLLLYYDNVNVAKIQRAIMKTTINGNRVDIKILPIKVTYDDVFNLIVAYNDVTTPVGVKDYSKQKVEEEFIARLLEAMNKV